MHLPPVDPGFHLPILNFISFYFMDISSSMHANPYTAFLWLFRETYVKHTPAQVLVQGYPRLIEPRETAPNLILHVWLNNKWHL